ncbi:MAG: Rne/Rng family ribonuclease [Alphaproteobacteria bacterium]|nr:MAG: Rne/Rng family ribonuclease [Alphaproteobacteria bacterium]
MTRIMLIDAEEQEETRVVIMNDDDIDHFDFISKSKMQIKGNIYLAKITRIEPALQAAFVEYGGDKQGFLSFSEVHPDYYQIPVEDREQLLREAAAMEEEDDEDEDETEETVTPQRSNTEENSDESSEETPVRLKHKRAPIAKTPRKRGRRKLHDTLDTSEVSTDHDGDTPLSTDESDDSTLALAHEHDDVIAHESVDPEDTHDESSDVFSDDASDNTGEEKDGSVRIARRKRTRRGGKNRDKKRTQELAGSDAVESPSSDDAEPIISSSNDEEHEERSVRRTPTMRRYKIQEVLRPGQIVLVQVVKEERGNKGVSLSTYISLAGRYCVLMPNSPRGGGVSRKIGSGEDRKRLREIAGELNVSKGMSAIIRTAGMDRTRTEIKRDYEYLIKLWNQVREDAIASIAPTMVYEESDIVKRSIRDHYNGDIDAIWVQGESAYKRAKEFMKLLTPSHAPRVKQFKASEPLFTAYGIERLLGELYHNTAPLASGGYIVINPTEALISIDVNSGRSITEKNVEETAYKTNLEACDEIARQLRLRNLGGLVVIDFIDMGYHKYRRHVERALREAFKNDRAKIQIGYISPFGLLEMSRQRMGASIIESTTHTCPTCNGTGRVPLMEATLMHIIRQLQSFLTENGEGNVTIALSQPIMLELLNKHRIMLQNIEQMYNVTLTFEMHTKDDSNYYHFKGKQGMRFASDDLLSKKSPTSNKKDKGRNKKNKQRQLHDLAIEEPELLDEEQEEVSTKPSDMATEESGATEPRKRGRNRRRRNRDKAGVTEAAQAAFDVTEEAAPAQPNVMASTKEVVTPSNVATPTDEAPKVVEVILDDTPPPNQRRRGWWGRMLEGS